MIFFFSILFCAIVGFATLLFSCSASVILCCGRGGRGGSDGRIFWGIWTARQSTVWPSLQPFLFQTLSELGLFGVSHDFQSSTIGHACHIDVIVIVIVLDDYQGKMLPEMYERCQGLIHAC